MGMKRENGIQCGKEIVARKAQNEGEEHHLDDGKHHGRKADFNPRPSNQVDEKGRDERGPV